MIGRLLAWPFKAVALFLVFLAFALESREDEWFFVEYLERWWK